MNNPSKTNQPPIDKKEVDKFSVLDRVGQETVIALTTSHTVTEAASKLSISRQAVYDRIKKYNLQYVVDEAPKHALNNIKLASFAASHILIGELNSNRNKLQAAESILDRAGVVSQREQTTNIAIQVNNLIDEDRSKFT